MIPEQATIKQFLQEGEVNLTFKKKNGELCDIRGTTNSDRICIEDISNGRSNPESDSVIVIYDLDNQIWSSFRYEQLTYVRNRSKVTVSGAHLVPPTKK